MKVKSILRKSLLASVSDSETLVRQAARTVWFGRLDIRLFALEQNPKLPI